MHFGDVIIGLAAICGIFVLPVVAWMFSRMLKHRERMAMYQAGYVVHDYDRAPQPGPVPVAAPQVQGRSGRRGRCGEADPPDVALRKGVGLAMIGMALTIGLSFIDYGDGAFHPGPWLLGGLIPLFIGLSHILMAILSGASFGTRQYVAPPPYAAAPPPPNGPTNVASPDFSGSYTYRPGDQSELTRGGAPPQPRR